jgi:hypothetical protein
MDHKIVVISNGISKEDCDLAMQMINEFNINNELLDFKDNKNVKVAPTTEKVKMLLNKYSDILCSRHAEIHNLNAEVYTTEAFLSLWQEGASAGVHKDNHYGYEFLEYSTVIYLNDQYDGGEICFPLLGYMYKPKAGDIVLFPCSTDKYLHGVLPVRGGNRFTIAMWHTTDKTKEWILND